MSEEIESVDPVEFFKMLENDPQAAEDFAAAVEKATDDFANARGTVLKPGQFPGPETTPDGPC